MKKIILRDLRKLFELTDTDKSGTITKEELEASLLEDKVRDKFDDLNIPIEDINSIFRLMDPTGRGVISLDDFIGACMQLIAGHSQKDIMQLAIQVRHRFQSFSCERIVNNFIEISQMVSVA